jgi:hypothetical protein
MANPTLCPWIVPPPAPDVVVSMNATNEFPGHNCVGDGITNNTTNVGLCIADAITAGKTLYFPPGTYLLGSTVTLPSNADLLGAGVTSIFTMGTKVSETAMFSGNDRTGISVTNLRFQTSAYTDMVRAFSLLGLSGGTFTDLSFDKLRYGFNFGTHTSKATGNTFTGISATNCWSPMLLTHIEHSTFTDLNLSGLGSSYVGQTHMIYLCGGCHALTFTDVTLSSPGGNGYALQLYEEGLTQGPISDITFNNLIASDNASGSSLPLVMLGDQGISNITFNTLSLTSNKSDGQSMRSGYNVSNVVFNNGTYRGGRCVMGAYNNQSGGPFTFNTGTYDQPYLESQYAVEQGMSCTFNDMVHV